MRDAGIDHHLSCARHEASDVTQIPIFEEAAIRGVITPALAVSVIRDAFRLDGERMTNVPPVINLEIPSAHGEFHIKTAHIVGVRHIAVKVASGFYDNPAKGLPSGSGLIALFDATTGLPAALLLDNGYLTDVRTGAAGAVAADVLARRHVETVGVIGSGVQARHQVHCLRAVREFSRVIAWSPTRSRLEAYANEMRQDGLHVTLAAGAREVCEAADLIIVATPAREPIVDAEWLRPGVHVNAVGSDSPGKQELEAMCLSRADVLVADRLSQCAAFGELKHAIHASLVTASKAVELGQIVAGHAPGRTNDAQITIADLTGVGFQDTAIASAAFTALALTPAPSS
jgi:ornithine cyclodeaminase/alanine dehydrogenase-like protein (mu-crystallin family)